MRISHLAVAESDDRPDVSTREVGSHELTAMPTCGGDKTLSGKWSEGPRAGIFPTVPWLFRNSVENLVETIMIDHARSCRRALCSPW